jgi:hypothetical protein
MIVVASHNRIDLLENYLNNLTNLNLNGHDVLIINTNSDDKDYIKFFQEIPYQYPKFQFETLNYTSWDSGAYIHAYEKYPRGRYIFLQDSTEITNPNLIPIWDDLLDKYEVVPWINFGYHYENEEQKEFTEQGLNVTSLPDRAITCPIFGIRKETLDKIPKEWLIKPYNKITGCGMERRWSLMFHLLGISKYYIELEDFSINNTIYTSFSNIRKHIFYRL